MKLSLGTAQFGLDYGITNRNGLVAKSEVGKILELAKQSGISILDTAIAYGCSEYVLGQFDLSEFDIITKIPPMQYSKINIDTLVDKSMCRLNISTFYGIMLHDENDVFTNSNVHLKSLINLKDNKIVKKIGASFYSAEKAMEAINTGLLDIIQIPANILDNRFESLGIFEAALQNNVEIHARSLFLQGLLAVDASSRPDKFKQHTDLLNFDSATKNLCLTTLETSLMYLSHKELISYGVVGCTNQKQLLEIIQSYSKVSELRDIKIPNLHSSDKSLLDPSKWN